MARPKMSGLAGQVAALTGLVSELTVTVGHMAKLQQDAASQANRKTVPAAVPTVAAVPVFVPSRRNKILTKRAIWLLSRKAAGAVLRAGGTAEEADEAAHQAYLANCAAVGTTVPELATVRCYHRAARRRYYR